MAAVLVGLCLALSPAPAHAHSCMSGPPLWPLLESEFVFVGSEKSVSPLRNEAGTIYGAWIEYDVLQTWKGNLPEVVRLRFSLGAPAGGAYSREPVIDPMLIYTDGEYVFFGGFEECKWSGPVWWNRRNLLEIAAVFVFLTALSSTVLLLTLSKALRSYHERFLAR